jgi:hypothetical protein
LIVLRRHAVSGVACAERVQECAGTRCSPHWMHVWCRPAPSQRKSGGRANRSCACHEASTLRLRP